VRAELASPWVVVVPTTRLLGRLLGLGPGGERLADAVAGRNGALHSAIVRETRHDEVLDDLPAIITFSYLLLGTFLLRPAS